MFDVIPLNEGDVRTVRIRLSKRDDAGKLIPAHLPPGTTPKLVIEDLNGVRKLSATMAIEQNDDADCIVSYEFDNSAPLLAAGRYRAKVRAIKPGTKPETYPAGDDFIECVVGRNIDQAPPP